MTRNMTVMNFVIFLNIMSQPRTLARLILIHSLVSELVLRKETKILS